MYSLSQKWIDDLVKEWNKDENEGRVHQLHLIRLNNVTANLTTHPGGLKGPS